MDSRLHLTRHLGAAVCVAVVALTVAFSAPCAVTDAPEGRRHRRRARAASGRSDWNLGVSGDRDWRWRMVTPPKGDVASIPVNARAVRPRQLESRRRQRGR